MDSEGAKRHILVARQALEQGAVGTAEANFRCAVQIMPEDAEARFGLALALSQGGKHEESRAELNESLRLQPINPTGWILLSSLYQRLGQFEEAIRASTRASEQNPQLSHPLVDILSCKTASTEDGPIIRQLAAMSGETQRSIGERMKIEYALGKAQVDLGDFERGMRHYAAANNLGASVSVGASDYDPGLESSAADAVFAQFTSEYLENWRSAGAESELPVFIIGMVRSGTTLLDTMLASHPLIGSAGELRFWEDRATKLLSRAYQGSLHPADIKAAADEFRRLMRSASFSSKRVIDKMPVNYQHAGLIRMAFPNARFIHCSRHPVDTCLSIYFTDFGPVPPRFAFDRTHIVHAYRTYRRYIDHWKSVVPSDRFAEVSYADLVRNREQTLARIVEFLGLDWSDEVLHHENSKSPIQTPSRWQARQPVYTSSLDRWKKFEPWLEEFSELL